MVRNAFMPQPRPQLDPARIVAISTAIAVNIALVGVLMRPLDYTPAPTEPDTSIPLRIITPPVKKVEVVHVVKVVKPPPPQPQQHVIQHVIVPPVITHDPLPMSLPVPPQVPVDIDPQPPQVVPMQTVVESLVTVAAPPPSYPIEALRDGIAGTVELELLVGVDGRVLKVRVTHSSGSRQLDNAASEQVLRNWSFQPASRGGVPVQALGRVPVVFALDGR
jgi:protein TonB